LARFRVLAAYKYIWILATIALFFALALFGQEVNGARLWIRLGPVQFEPVEVIKLLVVLFMASYLAETADVIARTRPWSLRANAKYLGPLFLGWGVSMASWCSSAISAWRRCCWPRSSRCSTSRRGVSTWSPAR
jgi:cell division protein FtsW (lipid II flippase)